MASSSNTIRNQFRVTVDGSVVSIYIKATNALVIRSYIINNADISFLSTYIEDLERAIIKYSKAATSMKNGNRQLM